MTPCFVFVLIFGLSIAADDGIVPAVGLNENEQFSDEQNAIIMQQLSPELNKLDVRDDNEIYIDDDNNNIDNEDGNNDAYDDDDDGDDDDDDDVDDDDDNDYHDAKNCGSGDSENLEADDEGWTDDEDYNFGSGSGNFQISDEKVEIEVPNEPEEQKTIDDSKYDFGLHHVCSEEYSEQCTAPLDNIESLADIDDEFCENRELLSCLHNIFENCVEGEDEIKKGIRYLEEMNAAVDLVCQNKGSVATTDPLECLSEVSEKLNLKVIECTTYAMKETESLMKEEELTQADKKCFGGHLVIECVTDAATQMCGEISGKLLELSLESDLKDDPDVGSSIYCQEDEEQEEEK